ncbi:MarR family winged helix-turn-helix transcriptional regulator [Amnibacterium flavum]|uniref:MarR family transcriptional regulator n=1 Tax=Amnibacterium flavum TaxID=2173173 RepID=A0A2V1HSQ8_9MICO|nr:MarR family transcriptional regulator [Amnibacterium flavum]PVZ94079.1 MarR family transcriptional regulator [Amnibacterium flavum]
MADGDIRMPFEGGTSFLLTACGAEVRKRWARMLADHGLTPHHFALLQVLEHIGEASQKELSSAVGIDPRNAPPLLDLLDGRDLITRADSTEDRRRQVIQLTPLGRSIVGFLQKTGQEIEEEYFAPLDADERNLLRRLLLRLSTRGMRGAPAEEEMPRAAATRGTRSRSTNDSGLHPFLY